MLIMLGLVAFILVSCSEADRATDSIKKSADDFSVQRQIVFFNGITDEYLLTIESLCSLGNNDNDLRMTVTCKTGEDKYKMHTLGLSDNVSFFSEQIEGVHADPFRYKVVLRPEAIIPEFDIQTRD